MPTLPPTDVGPRGRSGLLDRRPGEQANPEWLPGEDEATRLVLRDDTPVEDVLVSDEGHLELLAVGDDVHTTVACALATAEQQTLVRPLPELSQQDSGLLPIRHDRHAGIWGARMINRTVGTLYWV